MRRRDVIRMLVGAAVARPFAAWAQRRIPRIGYLGAAWGRAPGFVAFQRGLDDLGYVLGKNVEIESRFWMGGQEDEMEELARKLVGLEVDVIVTSGYAVYAAHRVTKTVPIVAT